MRRSHSGLTGILGMMGAWSALSARGVPFINVRGHREGFQPEPRRIEGHIIRIKAAGPAPLITGHREVLGRQTDRRDSFNRHFREISDKYAGETRRARRILARAAMKNEWKDQIRVGTNGVPL